MCARALSCAPALRARGGAALQARGLGRRLGQEQGPGRGRSDHHRGDGHRGLNSALGGLAGRGGQGVVGCGLCLKEGTGEGLSGERCSHLRTRTRTRARTSPAPRLSGVIERRWPRCLRRWVCAGGAGSARPACSDSAAVSKFGCASLASPGGTGPTAQQQPRCVRGGQWRAWPGGAASCAARMWRGGAIDGRALAACAPQEDVDAHVMDFALSLHHDTLRRAIVQVGARAVREGWRSKGSAACSVEYSLASPLAGPECDGRV
jgi:hypothetical protein